VVGALLFINLISTKIELRWSFFQNKLNEYEYILNSLRIIRQESIFNSNIELTLNNQFIHSKIGFYLLLRFVFGLILCAQAEVIFLQNLLTILMLFLVLLSRLQSFPNVVIVKW